MTDQQIESAAERYAAKLNWSAEARRNVCPSDFVKTFIDGAHFALTHQWISADKQLPDSDDHANIVERIEKLTKKIISK